MMGAPTLRALDRRQGDGPAGNGNGRYALVAMGRLIKAVYAGSGQMCPVVQATGDRSS